MSRMISAYPDQAEEARSILAPMFGVTDATLARCSSRHGGWHCDRVDAQAIWRMQDPGEVERVRPIITARWIGEEVAHALHELRQPQAIDGNGVPAPHPEEAAHRQTIREEILRHALAETVGFWGALEVIEGMHGRAGLREYLDAWEPEFASLTLEGTRSLVDELCIRQARVDLDNWNAPPEDVDIDPEESYFLDETWPKVTNLPGYRLAARIYALPFDRRASILEIALTSDTMPEFVSRAGLATLEQG